MEQEKTTWKEFIENISVLQWVLTFLIMGISCTILMLYLIFTSLWLLSVLYFIWMVIDWDTPERGGRRSDWIRNWSVWKHIRDYYPVTLVKTAELSPSKNFVLGYHPHGIMCAGAFSCFSTEGAGFSAAFPGIQSHLATLAGLFRLPLYRDYLMSSGMIPVSKPSLEFVLSRSGTGHAVVIVVGGAAESLNCTPGLNVLVMRERKGFVRLALEYGADLVPVYSFGENEIFDQLVFSEGSLARSVQKLFQRLVGFAPCLFHGQRWGLLPYRTPITTVVGKPIPVPQVSCPSQETVEQYHQLYMEALETLFHTYKTRCGLSDTHELQII